MSTATAIRTRRDEIGMTRIRLALAVGVAERTLARYENGEGQPPLDVAARLAEQLGCTVDDLVARESALP